MNKTNEIFNIAKRDGWIVEYDSDLDTLYWSKPIISDDTITTQSSEDFSLYITNKGLIEGLFIEYAKYNFVSHNKEYAPLFKQLKKVSPGQYVIPAEKRKSVEPILRNMAEMLASETLTAVIKGADLNRLATV